MDVLRYWVMRMQTSMAFVWGPPSGLDGSVAEVFRLSDYRMVRRDLLRESMSQDRTVFLLDVDNTLLDNDCVERDLRRYLDESFGLDCRNDYWRIFEETRAELGYADYLGALQRYRIEHPRNPDILALASFLIDYPFADRLYPGALEIVKRLRSLASVVILTDGDAVFQPRKIRRSGLWDAVGGQVLVYIHKEQMLDDVEQKYPADHYVMADDKLRILAAMKKIWSDRLTTVFVRQGHYAADEQSRARYPAADVEIETIGELSSQVRPDLLALRNP
jgi:FMN phosphatase YigB (HAD superfamily)